MPSLRVLSESRVAEGTTERVVGGTGANTVLRTAADLADLSDPDAAIARYAEPSRAGGTAAVESPGYGELFTGLLVASGKDTVDA